jgi:hypothetical protein
MDVLGLCWLVMPLLVERLVGEEHQQRRWLVKNTSKDKRHGDKTKIPSKGDFKNHCLVEFVET